MYHAREALRGDEQRWKKDLESAPEEGVRRVVMFIEEDFEFTKDDLGNSFSDYENVDSLVLIKGARLPPQGISEILSDRRKAVWLAPSHKTLETRLLVKHKGRQSEDKVRWMIDSFYGAFELYAEEAEQLGLGVVRVETDDSPEIVADRVAAWYGL